MSELLASWFGRISTSTDELVTTEMESRQGDSPSPSGGRSGRTSGRRRLSSGASGGRKLGHMMFTSEDTADPLSVAGESEVEKMLYVASGYQDFETVKRLLETKKGDLDWQNPNDLGKTALHKAAEEGCVTIIALLVAEGAEVGLRDAKNRTPLHLALENKHSDATSLLLETTCDALRKRTHACLNMEERVLELESQDQGAKGELDVLRDRVSELHANLQASEQAQRKLERDLKASSSDRGERIVQLETELEAERREHSRALKQAERRHRELTQRNEELVEGNQRLNKMLVDLEERLKAAQVREVQLRATMNQERHDHHGSSNSPMSSGPDTPPYHVDPSRRRQGRSKSISHVAHHRQMAILTHGPGGPRGEGGSASGPDSGRSSDGCGGSPRRGGSAGSPRGSPRGPNIDEMLGDPVIGNVVLTPPSSPESGHSAPSPSPGRLSRMKSESALFPRGPGHSPSAVARQHSNGNHVRSPSGPPGGGGSPHASPGRGPGPSDMRHSNRAPHMHRAAPPPPPPPMQAQGPVGRTPPLRRGDSFDDRRSQRTRDRHSRAQELAASANSPQESLSTRESDFARGIVCNGKYRLLHMEGKGGMATVWRAVGVESKDLVAIKIFEYKSEIPMTREKYVEYACRECAIHESMKHPNIVELKETFSINKKMGVFGVVMELCDGDLQTLLDEKGGTLSEREARGIMLQVFSALEYLATRHNVIHADLKPSNILFRQGQVKLADFGVSKEIPRGRIDVDLTTRFATVGYAAPEYYDPNNTTISSAVDVYAAGKIMYRMIVGDLPREQHGRVEYPLYFPPHIPISPEGAMFIRTCLADKRCDVAYICKHPYLH